MRRLDRLRELWRGEGPNLNAGCGHAGTCIVKPFINLDTVPYEDWKTKPHVTFTVGDVRKLEYPDNHFWVIFASELIEHFVIGVAIKVFKEFYRVLKPDGCLKIVCPDFKYAVNVYLGRAEYNPHGYDTTGGIMGKKNGKVIGQNNYLFSVIYGKQYPLENGICRFNDPQGLIYPPEDGIYRTEHLAIWDEERLKYWLERVGFKNVERVYDKEPWSYPVANERDLCMEAWK